MAIIGTLALYLDFVNLFPDIAPTSAIEFFTGAAPKPTIMPMLVTIADAAPKLTDGSLKAIICSHVKPDLHSSRD